MTPATPWALKKYYRTRCGYDTTERNEGIGEPFYRPADVEARDKAVEQFLQDFIEGNACVSMMYEEHRCNICHNEYEPNGSHEHEEDCDIVKAQLLLATLKGRTA